MRPAVHLVRRVALAVGLCAVGGAASAQGTAEQQEACAPDAFKFCAGTIPDIAKTTACMKAHKAELSARCQAAFNDATEKAPAAAAVGASQRHRTARAAPSPETEDQGHRRHTARVAPSDETEDGGYRRRRTAHVPSPPDFGDDDDRRDARAAPSDGPDQGDYYGRRDDADMRPEGPEGPAPYGGPPVYAGPRAYDDPPAYDGPRQGRGDGDRARASDEIGRLCADGMMDPRTCDLTERALGAGQ